MLKENYLTLQIIIYDIMILVICIGIVYCYLCNIESSYHKLSSILKNLLVIY